MALVSRPARDPFPALIGIVVVAFACWTVFCHLLVFTGASFATLLRWCDVPVGLALALGALLSRGTQETRWEPPGAAPAAPSVGSCSLRLCVAALIVLAYWLTDSYLLFWIAAMSFVAVTVFLEQRVGQGWAPQWGPSALSPTAWIAIAALAGALLTLISHRPDWDDAMYVGLATRAQAQPAAALLGPDVAPYYRVHTYEPLVAALASFTGLPVASVYYVVLPTLMGFLMVVVQCLAARELGGGHVLGFAMILIALVSWGDDHRSVGNFAFVRLFQGKAVVVSFFVPAILYYVARYVRVPSGRNWSLLALTQVAAVGFSCNALVVAPLSAAAFLMASLRKSAAPLKHAGLGLLASGYPVLMVLVALTSTYGWKDGATVLSSAPARAVEMWHLSGAGGDTAAGLREVLGSGLRGYLALFSVVGLAAVPIRAGTPLSSARLALAILGILLNPFCGDLLKPFVQSMTWRIFWAIPFSVILGLFTASLGVALRSTNRRWLGTAAAAAMCGAFALVPGTWTVAAADGTRIAFPGYKVDGSYGVADAAIHVTEPGGLILAPESVAVWIPTFSHPPRAVAVRRMYLDRLPAAEKSNRLRLFDLVEGAQLDDDQVASALREVVDRRVTTVVVSSTSMSMNAIRATLGSYGYSERVVDGHRVFVEIQP